MLDRPNSRVGGWCLLAAIPLFVVMTLALVVHAAGAFAPSTSIERFEAGDLAYSASVDAGTPWDDLGLPDELRAVVCLDDPDSAIVSFEQADPESLPDGYEAPSDADALREAGKTVVYTVGSDEAGTFDYRVYGSIDGADPAWYSSDEDGNLIGQVLDVPVTWEGDYDPDEPGTYTLTSSFTGYSYASTHPYAVITVEGESPEQSSTEDSGSSSSQEQSAPASSSGISTLAATGGTIYVNEDGTGDGTTSAEPAALTQDLLDELTSAATLVLVGDIELSERLTIPAGADVTIVDDGIARSISFGTGLQSGNIIAVEETATLTLETSSDNDGLLTVQGRTFSSATNVFFVKGTFVLKGGFIRDFYLSYQGSSVILIRDGEFEMAGGIVTNNETDNQYSGILVVNGNSDATISGGSISDNTINKTNSATVLVLAGAFASNGSSALQPYVQGDSTLTMTGGSISGNRATSSVSGNASFTAGVLVGNSIYGGNAYSSEATFTMTGGTITNNTGAAAGGGVYVCGSGNFYMEGGEISDNSAAIGGGVATYDLYVYVVGSIYGHTDEGYTQAAAAGYTLDAWADSFHMPATFEMTGGTITKNTASYNRSESVTDAGCGGGVYVASNRVVISVGCIADNYAGSQGGGVYVGSIPYTLHMYNTLVTENTAEVLGGGLWFCPTGDATLTVTNGSAVYGNIADSDGDGDARDDTDAAADDFVAVPQTDRTHTINLADRMLGGGEVAWYKDGGVVYGSSLASLGNADGSDRYDPENPGERITGIVNVTDGVAYKAVVSDNAAVLAERFATVYVTGNHALRGGGIGANGALVIGVEDDEWTLEVTKDWGDIAEEYRTSVTIRLVIGDYELDAVELNADNNWTATFDQLPNPDTLGNLEITVIEEGGSYQATYSDVSRDEDNKYLSIMVTNELLSGSGVIDGLPWRDANGDGIQQSEELDDTFDGMAVSLWRWNDDERVYEQLLGSSEDGTTTVDAPLAVTIQHGTDDVSDTYVVSIDGVYYTVTATATSEGGYEFSGLPAGTYRVEFTAEDIPMGSFTGSEQHQGDDDSVDSDADYVYVNADGDEFGSGEEYGQWLDRAYINGIAISDGEGTLESRDNDAGFVPRTGSITIVKTDEDGVGLNAVTFKLELLVSDTDENDPDAQWQTIAEGDETANTTTTIDGEDGKLVYDNLEPGIYRLTETGTTSGNSLLVEPVYITVPYDDGGDDSEVWDSDPSYMHDGIRYMLDLGYSIENGSVFALPSAGSSAWPWHLVAGVAIIVVAAGVALVASMRRRKRRIRRLRREIKSS